MRLCTQGICGHNLSTHIYILVLSMKKGGGGIYQEKPFPISGASKLPFTMVRAKQQDSYLPASDWHHQGGPHKTGRIFFLTNCEEKLSKSQQGRTIHLWDPLCHLHL